MPFTTEIQRIMGGVLLSFALVGASAAYWAIVGADSILQRADNPRVIEREARIQRGGLYDHRDTLLAETRPLSRRTTERVYHVPSAYSLLGYYSLRYGAGGLEASFNDILRGTTLPMTATRFFREHILHHAPRGSDIRLTLDAHLQTIIADAMTNHQGAVVVMRVADGAVMSLLSQPTFNPNTLDTDWVELIEDERNPFFNRAIQGQYQPGGIMQTPLMATAILTQQVMDDIIANATSEVVLEDIAIGCAIVPDDTALTLLQAYAHGCPQAYAMLLEQLPMTTVAGMVDAFSLNQISVADFLLDRPTEQANDLDYLLDGDAMAFRKRLLGQGDLTANPLAVTMMNVAMLNGGISLYPHLLGSIREPDNGWERVAPVASSRAFMTEGVARRLRDMWVQHVEIVPVFSALSHPEARVGVHGARALSGDKDVIWLVGFVLPDEGDAYAFTIVLENGAMVDAVAVAESIVQTLMIP